MKAIRVGLYIVLAFSVLAHGAVEVWSESLVEMGAAALGALWSVVALLTPWREIRWNPLNWPLLAFCGIVATQLLFHLTLYPFLTRADLIRAATCWIVFFLSTQAFQNRSELRALSWFLVLFCFAVSLEAIIQHFTAGTEIYWFREVGAGLTPFGPYVNRNHFGGFVELTLPIGLALLMLRGLRRDLVPMMTLLVLVPISAVVLSTSRGGMIGVAVEICVLAAFRLSRRGAERLRLGPVAVAVIAALVLIGWVGAGNAVARFIPSHAAGVPFGKRESMTRGAIHIFLAHPFTGAGLGTTVAVYPKFETMYDGKLVDHVHDDYAEALAETGLAGGVCGLVFFILLFRDARKSFLAEQGHFSRAVHAGAIAALVGLVLHSFVDFNLHIFSNALLFLLQSFLATAPPVPPSPAAHFHAKRAPHVAA